MRVKKQNGSRCPFVLPAWILPHVGIVMKVWDFHHACNDGACPVVADERRNPLTVMAHDVFGFIRHFGVLSKHGSFELFGIDEAIEQELL